MLESSDKVTIRKIYSIINDQLFFGSALAIYILKEIDGVVI